MTQVFTQQLTIATPPLEIGAIDFSALESIFAHFLESVGWSVAIIDMQGRVLGSSKWYGLCLHAAEPLTLCAPLSDDVMIGSAIERGEVHLLYRTQSGMESFCVPIVLHEQQVASLVIGPFLLSRQEWQALQDLSSNEQQAFLNSLTALKILNVDKLHAIKQTLLDLATHTLSCAAQLNQAANTQALIEAQVLERTQALALHNHILQNIHRGVPLTALLVDLAASIERQYPSLQCVIILLPTDSSPTRQVVAPSLLALQRALRHASSMQLSGERVIIDNVYHAQACPFVSLLSQYPEIRASWTQPIKAGNQQVLGSLTLYAKQARAPLPNELSLLESISSLLQIALERDKAESILKRYKTIIECTNEGFWLVDARGYLQEVNAAYAAMLGYSIAELQQMHISQLEAKEKHPDEVAAHIAHIIAHGHDNFETVHRHKHGHTIDVEISASFLSQVQQFFVFIRNISERKQVQRALASSELINRTNSERLALATKIAAVGVWDWEVNSGNIVWNDTMFDIYGITKSTQVNYRQWIEAINDEDVHKLVASMQKVMAEKCRDEIEFCISRPDGDIRYLYSAKGVVCSPQGDVVRIVGVNVDISDRYRAQETIKRLAFYDEVTGLANRRLLFDKLGEALTQTSLPLAVLMLDLDRFKAVNDSFGHGAGDELLQQVAQRLQAHVSAGDTVARLGGDEFVILLQPNAPQPLLTTELAQAVVYELSRPFILSCQHEVHIGVSIGISLAPQHGTEADSLLNNADLALYQAKHSGRGGFAYFSEQLASTRRERLNLEARLYQAIDKKQLRLFYQPQVCINTGRIIGAEALLRWFDGDNGLILPEHFICIAEESDLIVSLGTWVLHEVCRQGQEWLAQGAAPLNLSVNVSPYQFRRCDMYSVIERILATTRFPADSLTIEVTESSVMEHQLNMIEHLHALRSLGIHFAIDDFGIGYSSLTQLKCLPVDTLKIDKSFIDDIPLLADDMTIAQTIIAMGRALGLKILAEGVETQAQLAFLTEKGCDAYQGYLKSRPLPAHSFIALLRQSH